MKFIAAAVAVEKVGKPPAIEEQDHLLLLVQCRLDTLLQRSADQGFLKGEVHHLDGGHASTGHPLGQVQGTYLSAVLHEAVGLEGWGCASHDQRRPFLLTTPLGDLPGMVAGGVPALVAVLMLLVEDDQTKVFKRGEDSTAGPDGKAHFTGYDALPLLQPLTGSKGGVKNRHLVGKSGGDLLGQLMSQRYFGNQINNRFPLRYHSFGTAQEDFALAAAGHSVEIVHRLFAS